VALAAPADAGTYRVRCYGAGQTAVTSSPTVVTITTDTTKPTLVEARGSTDFVRVRLTFSEPLTAPSATTTGNYTIAGLAVTAAALSTDGYQVTLTTARQAENTVYTITENNVQDRGGNAVAADSTIQFNSAAFLSGLVAWERWNGGGSIAGLITAVADGTIGPSDVQWTTSLFESGRGLADQYRGRGWGWFKAPASGNYVFITTVDDNARLFLSTDANPANKKAIAAEATWSNNREWSSATEEQRSDRYWETEWPTWNTITLVKDRMYYLEGLWQEGGGGDGMEVTYIMEGAATPANGTPSVLTGPVIGTYLDPTTITIAISEQPQSLVQLENTTATFAVTASSSVGALAYQWQKAAPGGAFANVTGANAASYTTPILTLADDGTRYRVVLTVGGVVTKTSDEATITISSGSPPNVNVSDGLLKSRLESRDYDVQVVGSDADDVSMATGKDIVVLSSTFGSGNVTDTYKNVAIPVINWEQAIQDDMVMTTVGGSADRGTTGGQTALDIVDATHQMAAGFPAGNLTVVTATSEFAWGQPNANGNVVARLIGTANAGIYGYDKGALLTDGTPAAERRVMFFMSDNVAAVMNDAGWRLFDAAIDWAQHLAPVLPAPRIASITLANGIVTIQWTNGGTLQSTPSLTPPVTWTNETGSGSFSTAATGPAKYYRVTR